MKKFLRLLKKTFPNFVLVTFLSDIENHLTGCVSILDVGCGDNSPLKFITSNYQSVGLDGYKPSINKSQKKHIHNSYIYGDIKKLDKLVKRKSFDAVVALDVIEHLKKDDGYKFLDDCERIARKKVIINTPNGFVPQHDKNNKFQEHLSGWSVSDFKKRGYKVQGMYGTKFCTIFRNEDASLRFKPKVLWTFTWGILVEISHHIYTKKHPEHSIALLAIKKIT